MDNFNNNSSTITSDKSRKDKEIKEYVSNFKKEIEEKYNKSKINKNYKLIRKVSSPITKNNNSSINTMNNSIALYNLNDQNIKKDIKRSFNIKKVFKVSDLSKVIIKLGKISEQNLNIYLKNKKSFVYKLLKKYFKDLFCQSNNLKKKNYQCKNFIVNSPSYSTLKYTKNIFRNLSVTNKIRNSLSKNKKNSNNVSKNINKKSIISNNLKNIKLKVNKKLSNNIYKNKNNIIITKDELSKKINSKFIHN